MRMERCTEYAIAGVTTKKYFQDDSGPKRKRKSLFLKGRTLAIGL